MRRNVVLGGSIAGLGIAAASGLDLIAEGVDGPSGDEFAYYMPIYGHQRANPHKYWLGARGRNALNAVRAAGRSYQFWPGGLAPISEPDPLEMVAIHRCSPLSKTAPIVRACYGQRDSNHMPERLDLPNDGINYTLLWHARGPEGAYVLDGPAFVGHLSAHCRIRKGYAIEEIDLAQRRVWLEGRQGFSYDFIFCTLPLDYIAEKCFTRRKPRTSIGLQVLNVGMRLEGSCPIDPDVHQVLLARFAGGLKAAHIDFFDMYSNISAESFAPSYDGKRRVALAVKRVVTGPEPLPADEFRQAAAMRLRVYRFRGSIEAAEYHWLPYHFPLSDPKLDEVRSDLIHRLAKGGIYMVGGAARGVWQNPAQDLREGYASGASVT